MSGSTFLTSFLPHFLDSLLLLGPLFDTWSLSSYLTLVPPSSPFITDWGLPLPPLLSSTPTPHSQPWPSITAHPPAPSGPSIIILEMDLHLLSTWMLALLHLGSVTTFSRTTGNPSSRRYWLLPKGDSKFRFGVPAPERTPALAWPSRRKAGCLRKSDIPGGRQRGGEESGYGEDNKVNCLTYVSPATL
ncbi:hypothetical protein E2C01_044782 [Portunus trituberculatus]|uniref:Uncharacterized protein n=1 Tax=Portunus trituberculatus TaxID=210409 RepID=A0A5B7FZA2_PORTR|nr:hypothetical protein [Portunus trituberculatus]